MAGEYHIRRRAVEGEGAAPSDSAVQAGCCTLVPMNGPRASLPVRRLAILGTWVAAVACAPPGARDGTAGRLSAPAASQGPAAAGAMAPFDLGAVARRAHFAFRPEPDGTRFTVGHVNYQASVSAAGAVQLIARHASGASPASPPLAVETVAVSTAQAASWSAARAETAADGGLAIARGT